MSDATSPAAVPAGLDTKQEELLPALPLPPEAGDDPTGRPVLTAQVTPPPPVARPLSGAWPLAVAPLSDSAPANSLCQTPVAPPRRTDRLAIASAACGLTAFVPVISQVLGLWFGAIGLLRIRRARRQGLDLRGSGWAWTGLISSGIALLGWITLPALLASLGESFTHTTTSLQSLLGQ